MIRRQCFNRLTWRITFSGLILLGLLPVLANETRVLVYQKNGRGYVHDNLAASAKAIQELGKENGFQVEVTTNAAVFEEANLRRYQALIFANSNNEAFDTEAQRSAFERYIRSGGGFVGIHSSTGSERQWPFFQQVQGAKFLRHPPLQKFNIRVLDSAHPATAHLGSAWLWTDECYFFTNLNPSIQLLLSVDIATVNDPKRDSSPGQRSNGEFPLAWCHELGKARVFYTSLGHKMECYSDANFRKHLLGGIRWVLDRKASP